MRTRRLSLLRLFLGEHFDPECRIHFQRASEDQDLKRYFDTFGARGSTHMEPDGQIYVKIDDVDADGKGACLEELIHALQFIRDGNVPLGADDLERCHREIEAAACLLKHADRLKLSNKERAHCAAAIAEYRGRHAA